ncbi:MAG: MBL fold metallo-hydrolase [Candidatus Micrarchaeia archaeon]
MKLIFLGTGGGRVNVTHRFRSTSGFVIQGSKQIYVDPGPGVIPDAKKHKIKLNKIDAVFVSHPHLDHANDMNVLIEAMTSATSKKRGILFGSETLFRQELEFGVSLSKYHSNLLDAYYKMKPNDDINLDHFSIKATKAKHDNTEGIGFILEIDGNRIGYTGDTEYFKGISGQYKDLDLLIINILRAEEKWEGHLDKYSCLSLLKETKPKIAILTRFGGEYLKTKAEDVAKWLEKESKVKVIASYDGMEFEF